MNTVTLKLETLHRVPGLADDFDAQIEALVADCIKRPGLAKDRTLKVEIRIRPHATDPQDVTIEPVIATKRPSTVLDPIRGRCTKRNQLQFDWSAEGGDQSEE